MLRLHVVLFLLLSQCLTSLCLAGTVWHVSPRALPGIAADQQFRTINDAVKVVKPGDTVLIHTGIYREEVILGQAQSGTPEQPITFEAAPAAHVIITGADVMKDWTKVDTDEGNIYSTPWAHVFCPSSPYRAHPDDPENRLIGRCEQVFVDGYALRQVLSTTHMERGTFYVDETAKLLYAWTATDATLPGEMVEASTRETIWTNHGDGKNKHDVASYIHMRGLNFRYAADPAQKGGVIQNSQFLNNRGNGIWFDIANRDCTVRNCLIANNEDAGIFYEISYGLHAYDNVIIGNGLADTHGA
jgi:hypothetical protein